MPSRPIWITEADVTDLISLPEAIDALERVLAMEARDQAANMPKTHLMVASNDAMHAIGAAVADAGLCGTKTWVNVGGKSQTVLVLFSLDDGALRAVAPRGKPAEMCRLGIRSSSRWRSTTFLCP